LCIYTGDNVGEFIFWTCYLEVVSTPPEDLQVAHLVVVNEPGKARSVTKGQAAIKIVLDFVSGICSEVLSAAFPSSASGMKMSDHSW
jgi:hypothetical protein